MSRLETYINNSTHLAILCLAVLAISTLLFGFILSTFQNVVIASFQDIAQTLVDNIQQETLTQPRVIYESYGPALLLRLATLLAVFYGVLIITALVLTPILKRIHHGQDGLLQQRLWKIAAQAFLVIVAGRILIIAIRLPLIGVMNNSNAVTVAVMLVQDIIFAISISYFFVNLSKLIHINNTATLQKTALFALLTTAYIVVGNLVLEPFQNLIGQLPYAILTGGYVLIGVTILAVETTRPTQKPHA